MRKTDCVIVGAGIAGMTAAIYLKRANVDFVIIEKDTPGGVMNRTSKIENYPGVLDTDGVTIAMNVYQQIKDLEVEYVYGSVQKIKEKDSNKIVITDQEEIETKTIILASGRVPRKLGVAGEEQLIGKGISWCAICDGAFYKNKDVAIIGSGNSAFEEAIYLAPIARKIYLLFDQKNCNVEEELQKKVFDLKNLVKKPNLTIKEFIKEEMLKGIILSNDEKLDVEGVFVFTGYDPILKCIDELNIKSDNNYLVVDSQMRTSVKGIYACGDVIKKDVYQLTTAVGEASIAAIFVKRDLSNL